MSVLVAEPDALALPAALLPVVDTSAPDIEWALGEFAARAPRYALYHQYMRGRHRLTFVTRGYREAFRAMLAGLRCNLCPRVVHAVTDRIRLTGFEQHDTEAGTGHAGARAATPATRTDAQRAWALWQDARLDRHFNQVKTESVSTGDAYMLVWPDPDEPNRPRFYPQRADQVVARYDAERPDLPVFAAKLWVDGKAYRLNLYYPDRIEKYRTRGTDATTSGLPTKASAFDAIERVANEYGRVPIFPFPFEGGIGECGIADLEDIIPIQDALNKELCDLIIASEFGAFKQKYAIGVSADEEDEEALKTSVERLWTVANPDAKLGEFSANDLKNYTETIFAFAEMMALAKGIPLHLLRMSGTIPSGESLKTAEAPLVARVTDTQTDFGDVLEDMMTFALAIAGELTGDHTGHITAVWQSPESRAEKDHIDAIATKVERIQVPAEQAWRELEYSEEEIADFKALKAAAAPPVVPSPVVAAPAGTRAAVAAQEGE